LPLVGTARELLQFAFDMYRFGREEHVHRRISRADELAGAAPAGPRGDRLRLDRVAHRAAETSAGNRHVAPLSQLHK